MLQGGAVEQEVADAVVGVVVLQPGPVGALGRPDPRRPVAEPQPGVGQSGVEFEVEHGGIDQGLERVCQWATEDFDHPLVGQSTQDGGAATRPSLPILDGGVGLVRQLVTEALRELSAIGTMAALEAVEADPC